MYFTKVPHPANFAFVDQYDAAKGNLKIGKQNFKVTVESFESDVYHIEIKNAELWEDQIALHELTPPPHASCSRLRLNDRFELELLGKGNKPILKSRDGEGFGVMGTSAIFVFESTSHNRYYGMGEKTFGRLELSGLRTKFWNTDAWADFHFGQWEKYPSDPYYLSVPYVIVQRGKEFVGILIDSAAAPFIETGASATIPTDAAEPKSLLIGSEDGPPSIWIIYGPTLAELTQKLQKLVGVTPLPPLWSLGYHQSRWGYAGHDDLVRLDKKFAQFKIPCDGLWLDIDYMEGFRVFTYSKKAFPKGVEAAIAAVSRNHRRVVPIIDPGVKVDAKFSVYKEGRSSGAFCLNPQGQEFVGMVWPGRTVFPDFSLPQARNWWANYARDFLALGFAGAWLDMNDPSTGAVDPQSMLFQKGKRPHRAFHNMYALGMQMATRQGFLAAKPNERPFLLSRSGWIGTGAFSAVWTGDNVANRFYLKSCIPTSLNLSLSGIPFNGPDVGGFAGDTPEKLMLDWVKTCFLFPFMRNHSMHGSREQEPWRYSMPAMESIRHYIRLRYRLLPYLYNLFIDQEELGESILRPLLYHYDDPKAVCDQFLVGSSILQAPILEEEDVRSFVLPGRQRWYDASTGRWLTTGDHKAKRMLEGTPLFFRAGSIIPCQPGERTDNSKDLANIQFHLFFDPAESAKVEYRYRFDDGISYGYRKGERSEVAVKVVAEDGRLSIEMDKISDGFGSLKADFVVYGSWKTITVSGKTAKPQSDLVIWTGKPIPVKRL